MVMTVSISLALATLIAIALPGTAAAQERVDSAFHLTGARVTRRPPTTAFVDSEYILLHGARTDHGCTYPAVPWGRYRAERIVETDDAACLQIRTLGFLIGQPTSPNVHTMIATFGFSTDSRRSRGARDSSVRRAITRMTADSVRGRLIVDPLPLPADLDRRRQSNIQFIGNERLVPTRASVRDRCIERGKVSQPSVARQGPGVRQLCPSLH